MINDIHKDLYDPDAEDTRVSPLPTKPQKRGRINKLEIIRLIVFTGRQKEGLDSCLSRIISKFQRHKTTVLYIIAAVVQVRVMCTDGQKSRLFRLLSFPLALLPNQTQTYRCFLELGEKHNTKRVNTKVGRTLTTRVIVRKYINIHNW